MGGGEGSHCEMWGGPENGKNVTYLTQTKDGGKEIESVSVMVNKEKWRIKKRFFSVCCGKTAA